VCSLESAPEILFKHDVTEVVVTRLDPPPQALAELATWLSDAERARAARFRFHRDCRRFIVARARLRQLLAERLDVPPESVELGYGKQGKPELGKRFAHTGWRFNVAHSDDVAVYALSAGHEVGIDVEAIRTIDEADAIAARLFSRREHAVYLSLPPQDKALGFFHCWTRKEAVVKALGNGLSMPLDQFDVSLMPGEPARLLGVAGARGDGCGWRLESFSPLPGFIAAVASHPG